MKKEAHPKTRKVAFKDATTACIYLIDSCATVNEKIQVEGQIYDGITVQISANSHPFWTGEKRFVDAAGRIDRFNARFAKKPEVAAAVKEEVKLNLAKEKRSALLKKK